MGRFLQFIILSIVVLIASRYFFLGKVDEAPLDSLPKEISGNKNSQIMLIFLHGYPNTFRLWDKLIDQLKKDYLCVNLSYPNFAEGVQRPWGVDIDEIVDLIPKTIDAIEATENKKYKKMVVAHDWGAVIAYLLDFKYPKFIHNLVTMDVGASFEESVKAKLFIFSYQIYLTMNFLIGGKIGKLGTTFFINNFAKVYGLSNDDHSRIDSSWNYLYYYLWKKIFHYKKTLSNYVPSCPVAFIYGTQKSFMFHNEKFLNLLNSTKDCEVNAVEEGHWVMNKNFATVLSIIKRRAQSLN
jgi:pimeloyl-ACP methyl ester carboxylesterase